jgi:RimJ/RimL family protein N-acetyltransferase
MATLDGPVDDVSAILGARQFQTSRLVLRRWTLADRTPFAALNADPEVMEFMPAALDAVQSNAIADRIEEHFEQHGFGLWAIQIRNGPEFVGFVGLQWPSFATPFEPCVELSWRLARKVWGHGYATEAAREVCRIAFSELQLPELVAFTVPPNTRSRRVMERLGMVHVPSADFDHPRLPAGHALRRHVLYRLVRDTWSALEAGGSSAQ